MIAIQLVRSLYQNRNTLEIYDSFLGCFITFGLIVIVMPQAADLVLATHIPHREGHALTRGHRLHVEAQGGDRRHHFIQLQFVQDCRLSYEMNRNNDI